MDAHQKTCQFTIVLILKWLVIAKPHHTLVSTQRLLCVMINQSKRTQTANEMFVSAHVGRCCRWECLRVWAPVLQRTSWAWLHWVPVHCWSTTPREWSSSWVWRCFRASCTLLLCYKGSLRYHQAWWLMGQRSPGDIISGSVLPGVGWIDDQPDGLHQLGG